MLCFVKFNVLLWFYFFWRPLLYFWRILFLFFFHVDKVFLARRKSKQHPYGEFLSAILWVPYTLFFYDFFSARRFVAMEAMIVKFQNAV